MQQDDKFNYSVVRGEKVTITFTLQNLPSSAVSMGKPWKREPGTGHPQFTFTIPKKNQPKGDQTVFHSVSEVSFVEPPPGAKAKITTEGSKGGGEFTVRTITVNTPNKETELKFFTPDVEDDNDDDNN
jgi:hypothetical protein